MSDTPENVDAMKVDMMASAGLIETAYTFIRHHPSVLRRILQLQIRYGDDRVEFSSTSDILGALARQAYVFGVIEAFPELG